ncbi:MAG: hypothetical protein WC370_07140 [Dehalococcoidales bacterium]|jgi:aspartate/methionine/tyrosine aminotransferase
MTRAVIKLAGDISYAMPLMASRIETCAYNAEEAIAAFRYKDYGVVVHPDEVMALNAGSEAAAVEVMDYIKEITGGGKE